MADQGEVSCRSIRVWTTCPEDMSMMATFCEVMSTKSKSIDAMPLAEKENACKRVPSSAAAHAWRGSNFCMVSKARQTRKKREAA